MTETEWAECTDPTAMLDWLRQQRQLFERKARLFAVACCRRIWPLLTDERSRTAVEVAERYADGLATAEELDTASDAACAVLESRDERRPYPFSAAAYNAAIPPGWWGAAPAFIAPNEVILEAAPDRSLEGTRQCQTLRDMFGHAFRPVTINPPWLTLNNRSVPQLAQTAYEDRRLPDGTMAHFHLALLANALEDARCTNVSLLNHLRGPGPHVRGCFVLDLILGKA
jgi:hypothetical protein